MHNRERWPWGGSPACASNGPNGLDCRCRRNSSPRASRPCSGPSRSWSWPPARSTDSTLRGAHRMQTAARGGARACPPPFRRAAADLGARLRPAITAGTRGLAARGMPAALDAEVRLLWRLAPAIKWPWLLASITAVAYPTATVVNVFLILCAPLVAEAAALDHIHATRAVIRSQPAIGRPRVLWTLSAVTLFLLLGGAPALLGIAARSPSAALAFGTALVFVAAFSVSAGTATRGGKLFLATYTLLWYAAASTGTPALDFLAVFRPAVQWSAAGVHLTLSALCVAVALIIEGRRTDG